MIKIKPPKDIKKEEIAVKKGKLKTELSNFIKFLRGNAAIPLAIAVISGNAINQFVNTLVNGIITPVIELIVPKGRYENLIFQVRNSKFLVGQLISSIIYLFIIMTIVYIIAKFITKDEELLDKFKGSKSKNKK